MQGEGGGQTYFSSYVVNSTPGLWNNEQYQAFKGWGEGLKDFCQACILPLLRSSSSQIELENSQEISDKCPRMPHTGIQLTAQLLSIPGLCKNQTVHSIELVAQMGVGSGIEE